LGPMMMAALTPSPRSSRSLGTAAELLPGFMAQAKRRQLRKQESCGPLFMEQSQDGS
jgi:hypothetical protein